MDAIRKKMATMKVKQSPSDKMTINPLPSSTWTQWLRKYGRLRMHWTSLWTSQKRRLTKLGTPGSRWQYLRQILSPCQEPWRRVGLCHFIFFCLFVLLSFHVSVSFSFCLFVCLYFFYYTLGSRWPSLRRILNSWSRSWLLSLCLFCLLVFFTIKQVTKFEAELESLTEKLTEVEEKLEEMDKEYKERDEEVWLFQFFVNFSKVQKI